MRHFLNTCHAIEKNIAAIYRQFSQNVRCEQELQDIWTKMTQEEERHALDIAFAARLASDINLQEKDVTLRRALQMKAFSQQTLQNITTQPPSRQAAVELSLKLEEDFLAIHVTAAVEFSDESLSRMFHSIAQDEKEHCRTIKAYHSRYFS